MLMTGDADNKKNAHRYVYIHRDEEEEEEKEDEDGVSSGDSVSIAAGDHSIWTNLSVLYCRALQQGLS